MKILIVDDLETNRKLLRLNLQAEGFSTVEAADGLEALAALKKGGIDVIISDILMPNMDGYSFCRAVRADPKLRALPIIIYTSTYISPSDEGIAKKSGADKYLRKPAPAKEVIQAIRDLTESSSPKRRTKAAPASEGEILKQYSEILVHKLEDKTLELHDRNKKLEASEELFRQLVENLEQIFFLNDAVTGSLLYISPAFETIWGRSAAALEKNPALWLDAVLTDDRPMMEQVLKTEPDGRPREYRIVRPDGSMRWIRSRSFPIKDKAGKTARICGIAEDVTALKSTEGQLQQAQKMESIGRLAGGVAHDFNNVLTAISGYSEFLLMEKEPGPQYRDDIQEILNAARRAATLTSQLLAFSRKQPLLPKVFNLNDTVKSLDKMLRRLVSEDIRMELRCAPDLWLCKADPGQLDQVIMNLTVNARDAMPSGGSLTIETANVEKSGSHIRLTVSDTGTGMTADVLAHLFEPFFTTKEKGKGTGLGLSTVYGIVRQSGGHIEVRSEVGRGTAFDVYLTRAEAAEAPLKTPPTAVKPKAGKTSLLLVEDDDNVRPVTRRMLAGLGYDAVEARDGLEALEIARKSPKPFDLALIDMIMPGASGLEVLKALRERYPKLRVVCMSGYIDSDLIGQPLDAATLFLQKPFTRQALAEKLAEALARPA